MLLNGNFLFLYISTMYCTFLMTVLFSYKGGHTTEMIRLVSALSSYYQPRIYIVAETDNISAEKIVSFEKTKKGKGENSEVCS